jgi:hypothetical protein
LWKAPADGKAGLRRRERGNTVCVPSRNDLLLTNLEDLQQDLSDIWRTLTRDPAKEARKERAWTVLAGVFTALGAIMARKTAAKVYGILTGETAPIVRQPPAPPGGGPSSSRAEPQPGAEPGAETQVSRD